MPLSDIGLLRGSIDDWAGESRNVHPNSKGEKRADHWATAGDLLRTWVWYFVPACFKHALSLDLVHSADGPPDDRDPAPHVCLASSPVISW